MSHLYVQFKILRITPRQRKYPLKTPQRQNSTVFLIIYTLNVPVYYRYTFLTEVQQLLQSYCNLSQISSRELMSFLIPMRTWKA